MPSRTVSPRADTSAPGRPKIEEPPTAPGGSGQVARCTGCQWEGGNHDELLRLFEDAAVMQNVVGSLVEDEILNRGADDTGQGCSAIDVPDFIRRHNWPDATAATFFANDLEALRNAYRAQGREPENVLRVKKLVAEEVEVGYSLQVGRYPGPRVSIVSQADEGWAGLTGYVNAEQVGFDLDACDPDNPCVVSPIGAFGRFHIEEVAP